MQLKHYLYHLRFKHPFGVSSNTRTETPSVFVELQWEQVCGYGEACLPAYLGETVLDTQSFLETSRSYIERLRYPFDIESCLQQIDLIRPGANAAKAALDIALHDLNGKLRQEAVSQLYGISHTEPTLTSFTIGIDREEVMAQKIKEASEFKLLKIKAGTPDDRALIRAIRRYTNKPLIVDVNQGWTNKAEALELASFMNDQNVLLLEQPMPVAMKEEMAWLTARSPLPTYADESAKRLADLESVARQFSGINIKLMKSAGIREATRMIEWCRQNGKKVMLGCMAESSCATSAMAQLMSLADVIDLDAPLLYKNDPFKGVSYADGFIHPAPGFGCGVQKKETDPNAES